MSRMEVVTVPGKDAVGELKRLRGLSAATGLYPILFGEEPLEGSGPTPEEITNILRRSEEINLARWLSDRPDPDPEILENENLDWSEAEAIELVTHLDIRTNRPLPKVFIGRLKLNAPCEAFAHLGYGGWNDCPAPEEHVALHRSWEARFGAQVVSITSDIVQCAVERPPTTREACLALAREHYAYCYDIVEQGTETIPALAAGLRNARYWYFWWD